jgi:hypothetical protein
VGLQLKPGGTQSHRLGGLETVIGQIVRVVNTFDLQSLDISLQPKWFLNGDLCPHQNYKNEARSRRPGTPQQL